MTNKSKALSRTKVIRTRVTDHDYEAFQRKVESSGISQSEYIRKCLLKTPIRPDSTKAARTFGNIQTLLNKERLCHDPNNIDLIQEEVSALCRYLK